MIVRNEKEMVARYRGTKVVSAVYHGAQLIWQYIRSCFGNGYWVNNMPWKNDEAWKNN